MKYLRVVEIAKAETIPVDELKHKREILDRFIDYVIRRMYLKRDQYLKCDVLMVPYRNTWWMLANFSRCAGSPIEPRGKIKSTATHAGPSGIIIIGNDVFQELAIDCDSFPIKMPYKRLALSIVEALKVTRTWSWH